MMILSGRGDVQTLSQHVLKACRQLRLAVIFTGYILLMDTFTGKQNEKHLLLVTHLNMTRVAAV